MTGSWVVLPEIGSEAFKGRSSLVGGLQDLHQLSRDRLTELPDGL